MKPILLSSTVLLCFTFFHLNFEGDHYTSQDPLQESIKRGADVYADFCMNCHLASGEGVENVYPPLANSDYLMKHRKESIHGLKYGQQGEIVVNGKTYNNFMPPPGLGDDEIADVMNYINNSWGNKNTKMVTEAEVAAIKK